MSRIDYGKISWNAKTNWEFCGSYENLREVWNRYWDNFGVRLSIEEFGYKTPYKGLAFKKGDVVTYTQDNGERIFAVVDIPVNAGGYFCILLPDGHQAQIVPGNIPERIAPAEIPDELMTLARAEAVTASVDLSRCPLKKAGVCMEAE